MMVRISTSPISRRRRWRWRRRRKPLLQIAEIGIVAAVEADEQRHAGFCDHRQALFDALDRQRDRLFAEDGLAGAGRLLDQVGVGIGRGADEDRVNVLGGDDLLHRGRLRADGGGKLLRRLGNSVGDVGDAGAARSRDGLRVHIADPASTEHSKPHHFLPPRAFWWSRHTRRAGGDM